jgi:hypothetical protein
MPSDVIQLSTKRTMRRKARANHDRLRGTGAGTHSTSGSALHGSFTWQWGQASA